MTKPAFGRFRPLAASTGTRIFSGIARLECVFLLSHSQNVELQILMKHRVLPALLQVFLLATVATSARAQSQLDERIKEWQSRTGRVTSQLAPASSIAKEYGLSGVLREFWGSAGWESESRTTHWYQARVRSESFDETWASVRWIPSSFTTYRPDGLVDTTREWDSTTNTYVPGVRFSYEFVYDFFTGQAVLEQRGASVMEW